MTQALEEGALGNLTIDQTRCLQEAWVHLLRLSGFDDPDENVLNRNDELQRELINTSPAAFNQRLWGFIVADHPDATVLRFLRARKWDVEKSMAMLASAINWREERRIDEEIVHTGEAVGLKSSPTADEDGFIKQYRSGKSYVRATDNEGRPVYIIKVRLHDPNMQSSDSMETYVLHNIESIRMMTKQPIDKACLIFDLSGFGIRNMDFHVVKFLVQVFEARYPETLGLVLVHNAPFVFWGIWSVIKRWLDPVIAAKINFTSGADIKRFVPLENLQKCYGGKDGWEYKYLEPVPGENDKAESDEKRAEAQTEREGLMKRFHQLTAEWAALDAESPEAKEKDAERGAAAAELHQNYWRVNPYIRARTYYQRAGVVDAEGKVNFKAAT